MKIVFLIILINQIFAGNNRSENEFVIQEDQGNSQTLTLLNQNVYTNKNNVKKNENRVQQIQNNLQPIANRPIQNALEPLNNSPRPVPVNNNTRQIKVNNQQIRNVTSPVIRNSKNGARGIDGADASGNRRAQNGGRGGDGLSVLGSNSQPKKFDVMVPEQFNNNSNRKNTQNNNRNNNRNINRNINRNNNQNIQRNNGRNRNNNQNNRVSQNQNKAPVQRSNFTSISQQNNSQTSSGPQFNSFGKNQAEDMKYQKLLSKLLNFGMLSMFTDLTDQATKISLLLVLRQDRQIAGKEIFKVIYKVDNPKYATGTIYYGAELAVPFGLTEANINKIDFITFGKSVFLDNVLKLLSIDQNIFQNRGQIDFMNTTKNPQGQNFNGQSKSAMVEFIQTILSVTQTGSKNMKKEDCDDTLDNIAPKKDDSPLIGSGINSSDLDGIGERI